jgi:hypothetical protein
VIFPLLFASTIHFPPPFSDLDPSVKHHDGFYLRLGAGLGALVEEDSNGLGIPSELGFGGTIAPGLVLGVGNFGVVFPEPRSDRDAGQLAFNAWGPFVDYYFDPHAGAHVEAGVMFTYGLSSANGDVEAANGPGFGAVIGGGYEWWVGEQWSIGPILRATYYSVTLEGTRSGEEWDVEAFVPAILFGATYH